jgi:hypothetical protein
VYLFRSKINCFNCLNNFRGKLERNKRVYICGGYSKNSDSCHRYVVHESDLIKIIEGHLKLKSVIAEGSLRDFVKVIEVDPINKGYKIIYNDDSFSLISGDDSLGIKYKL